MLNNPPQAGADTGLERFERVLSQPAFEGLKAILDRLSSDRATIYEHLKSTNSYEELLASLGHKVTVTRQIHVQDCYSRVSQEGGIRAVIPYHDIPTHGSMPTLVNLDETVTTTTKAVEFFNGLLREMKKQLNLQS